MRAAEMGAIRPTKSRLWMEKGETRVQDIVEQQDFNGGEQ
jgi:hypothetical protein